MELFFCDIFIVWKDWRCTFFMSFPTYCYICSAYCYMLNMYDLLFDTNAFSYLLVITDRNISER